MFEKMPFAGGMRHRLLPAEQACEHSLVWEEGCAVEIRRPQRAPFETTLLVDRTTVVRVLQAGAGTRLSLGEGQGWAYRGGPATHVLPPGTRLGARFEGGCAMAVVSLSDGLMRRAATVLADPAARAGVALDMSGPVLGTLVERIGERCRAGSPLSLAWIRSVAPVVALEILTRGGTAGPAAGEAGTQLPAWRLRRLDALIEAELDQRLTLDRMAAAVGLSVFHFARCFRATLGITPQTYVLLRRCERARDLLAAGALSLAEVALACGFANQSHFTTVFKRMEGVTPGQWRQGRARPRP